MKHASVWWLVATLLLTGCGTFYTAPQSRYPKPHSCVTPTWVSTSRYDLGIIELDDQGWLIDRADAERVVRNIEEIAKTKSLNVSVFVHGWHHNARPSDCNLQSFRRVLDRLDQELQMKEYRQARVLLTGDPDVRTVGLYIGWRGRSLPSFLDYVTFWDRRPAAIRVGHGDLPSVLSRLQAVYEKANQRKTGFMGLVATGHSFGGQVLFAAVSDLLKIRAAAAIPLTGQPSAPVERFRWLR